MYKIHWHEVWQAQVRFIFIFGKEIILMDCLSAVSRPLVDIESRSPMTTSGAMPSDIALSKPESTARTSSNFGRKSNTRLSGQGPPLMINALFYKRLPTSLYLPTS